jgi:hypothetical protein
MIAEKHNTIWNDDPLAITTLEIGIMAGVLDISFHADRMQVFLTKFGKSKQGRQLGLLLSGMSYDEALEYLQTPEEFHPRLMRILHFMDQGGEFQWIEEEGDIITYFINTKNEILACLTKDIELAARMGLITVNQSVARGSTQDGLAVQ